MKIAVTYQDGMVFQHFGHSQQFKLYGVENGNVIESKIIDTNGQGHGALAGFLSQCHADILICGGIGAGAQSALSESGIQIFGGVSGSADEAVLNYCQVHYSMIRQLSVTIMSTNIPARKS